MEARFDIGRIFWPLLIGGFFLAVVGTIVAIWASTRPFLRDMQVQTMTHAVELNANTTATFFQRNGVTATYLASDPVVVDYAVGSIDLAERVIDRLSEVTKPEEVVAAHLFDFAGDPLLTVDFARRNQPDVPLVAVQEAAKAVLALEPAAGAETQRFTLAGQAALIAVPVVSFGYVEGVIVTIVDLSPLGFLQNDAADLAMRLTTSEEAQFGRSEIARPVPGTGLILSHVPDAGAVDRAGFAMVRAGTFAVLLSLMFPFGVLAAFGHRSIVKPARELAESRDLLRRQKKELSELAAIAMRADESILITDMDGKIRWVNPAMERMSGYTRAELVGHAPEALLAPDARPDKHRKMLESAFRERRTLHIETLNRHKSRPDYWIRLHVSPLADEDGVDYGFVCISTDITQQRENEMEIARTQAAIEFQALHDELTGLANRRCFNAELDRRMAARPGGELTLIRLDLDHFKAVNDTLGHAAGDAVLQRVADILKSETRATDLPVRIGGDEFVILLDDRCTVRSAGHLAERMRAKIAEESTFEGRVTHVTSSIGIASTENGILSAEQVLGAADTALYAAKEAGRDQVILYDAQLNETVAASRTMEEDLHRGLKNGEFVPFYQPKVDAQTYQIVGVEVLMRWNHPEKGMLPPGLFMDAAARLGILERLDTDVMKTALRDVSALEAMGITIGNLAFNVTAHRLGSPELLDVLASSSLTQTKISLEILESVFLDDDFSNIDGQIRALRDTGVSIEIDDFGSGHASVIAMMRIKPDVLKIDGRLVGEALNSQQHKDILNAVIEIAAALNLTIVAEGVETMDHADLMRQMGCQVLQGYAFAKPMPVADLQALCRKGGLGINRIAS